MGERKGQNKYYPPDFDPQKHRSLDNYHGTHPLRNQAKKIHLGILEIRFEMPYNIWCGGCGIHIAMGVRYNAEKTKIGMYYTTPLYQFRMRCHLCPNYIVIKTEPKTHEYVITEGARRKEQRWDPKENGQIVTEDKDVQKKMAADAMFNLEHASDDRSKVKTSKPIIDRLEAVQDVWRDDYALNSRLRDSFRTRKRELKAIEDADDALLKKSSLEIVLLPEQEDDVRLAQLLHTYKTVKDQSESEKRELIMNTSIFSNSSPGIANSNAFNSRKRSTSHIPTSLKSLVVKKPRHSVSPSKSSQVALISLALNNSKEESPINNSKEKSPIKSAASHSSFTLLNLEPSSTPIQSPDLVLHPITSTPRTKSPSQFEFSKPTTSLNPALPSKSGSFSNLCNYSSSSNDSN